MRLHILRIVLEYRFSALLRLPKLSAGQVELSELQLRPRLGWIILNTELKSLQRIRKVLLLTQLEIGQAKLVVCHSIVRINLYSIFQLDDGFSILTVLGVRLGFLKVRSLLGAWIGTVGGPHQHPRQYA